MAPGRDQTTFRAVNSEKRAPLLGVQNFTNPTTHTTHTTNTMCQHRSYKVTKDGRVLSLIDNDSHTAIEEKFNLRDTALYAGHHTSIEMLPDRLDDCSGWKLHFDDTQPDWWTPDHEKAVRDQLRRDHAVFWNPKTRLYQFNGTLYLGSLTDAKGVTFPSTCGTLYLGSEKHFSGGWISKAEFFKLLKKERD